MSAFSGSKQCNGIQIAKVLIDAGANINHQSNSGYTVLMYNCFSAERIDLLQLLISAGADLNLTNNWGDTALGRAKKLWGDAATKDTAIQLLE